jgi:UDP-N-acetylglucosamine acyltransferase
VPTLVHPTAVVDPGADLDEGVEVGPYAVVGADVRIGAGTWIGPHAVLEGPLEMGRENRVFAGAVIGTEPQDKKYAGGRTRLVVGDRNVFRECVTANRGTEGGGGETAIGSDCLFMAYAHVAHDCRVGDGVVMANCATLAGHVVLEDRSTIGGLTPVHQFVRVGRFGFVGGMTRLSQDVAPFTRVAGVPAECVGLNAVGLERAGFTPDAIRALEQAAKILFRSGLNTSQALDRIRADVPRTAEVAYLVEFVEKSDRGLTK